MSRGRWIAVAAVSLAVVGGIGIAVPRLARSRVRSALAARTGCAVEAGDVAVGVSGVVVHDVRLLCSFGEAELARVGASIDWWALTPTAVSIVGGRVSLAGRPRRAGAASEAGGGSSRPVPIRIRDLVVELREADQVLVSARLDAEGGGTLWSVTASELATSRGHDPALEIAEASVTFSASDRVFEDASLQGVEVTTGEGPPLLQSLRRWARNDTSPAPDVPEGAAGDEEASDRPAFWALLREGGAVRVREARVRDAQGIALSDLEMELTRLAGAQLRVTGRGQPRGAGSLAWDLRVDAAEQRPDGTITLRDVPLSVFAALLPRLPLHQADQTLVTAEARVSTDDAGAVLFDGRLNVEGLALESPRIASAPVLGITFELDARGSWRRQEHTLEIERGALRMGGASATLSGRGRLDGDDYALSLSARLPPTPCDRAIHAIPAGILEELVAIHLDGRIAAGLEVEIDSTRLEDAVVRFAVEDACQFTAVPAMADVARFAGPFTHEVLEPDETVFRMDTGPGTPAWTPINEISPFLVHAVLAHEDASFFAHEGFAPWAIRDALVRNLRERRYVLGASTITMQLVKNVFLRREKTLARKVQEVLLTWWLETALTKAQILELYLNVIEYGPGVYGIRHAASHYFGRIPSELSVAESAYLAMILPNPPRFHEHRELGVVPPAFLRRTRGFVGIMEQRGRIDAEAAAQGREELDAFVFSRSGERVGPEILRGGSAQLPIEGFSGFPAVGWASSEEGVDEGVEDAAGEDEEPGHEAWEDVWP